MDAHEATITHFCKFPGCQNEASSPVGRYSYCREHQNRTPVASRPRDGGEGSTAKQLRETLSLAKQVDVARKRAERATREALRLKAAADTLEQAYRDRLREIVSAG